MQTPTLRNPFVGLALLLGLGACTQTSAPGAGGTGTPTKLGDPIAGLTPAELAAFTRGLEVFERRFTPEEGLGPLYNATSCASCHSTPVSGGSGQLYRNFYLGLVGQPGAQFPFAELPSPVIPAYGSGTHIIAQFTLAGGRFVIPWGVGTATITVAQRNAVPMSGPGMFEFVSDATILSNADPDDADADGISGRVNYDRTAIGRLGVKAQSNNSELFTRAPLQNQMGITTDPFEGDDATVSFMLQASSDPNEPTEDNDGVADPELNEQDLGDLIAYTRFLAPPQPLPFDAAAQRGEALFDSIGCTQCHIPTLPSSRGDVNAYTDLLLHDMGPALADGLTFGVPQPSTISPPTNDQEFRTQPLWGVSMHGPWLHDGRAGTLELSILLHGGEAQAIRDAYAARPQPDKDDVLAFLRQL